MKVVWNIFLKRETLRIDLRNFCSTPASEAVSTPVAEAVDEKPTAEDAPAGEEEKKEDEAATEEAPVEKELTPEEKEAQAEREREEKVGQRTQVWNSRAVLDCLTRFGGIKIFQLFGVLLSAFAEGPVFEIGCEAKWTKFSCLCEAQPCLFDLESRVISVFSTSWLDF